MQKMKHLNRKIILGVAALICAIGVIALCSFFPFIIDPSQWQNSEFLSDELIVTAIVVFSVVCVMMIGQTSNAQNPNSQIARARTKFYGNGTDSGSVHRITKHDKISAFSQWVKQVFQPKDIRVAKERMVRKCGAEDITVLDLEETQIKELANGPQKFGEKYYKQITKQQAKCIIRAKRLMFTLVDASYYLTCSSEGTNETITERSGGETKKKAMLLSWSIISKVVMSVVVAMIFASLVYDTTATEYVAKAWMKFASRMFSMATSSFLGYNIGCQTNDIDASYIDMKCLVHDQFFEDKSFVPKSQQEEAKAEFEKKNEGQ